jgi:hypothetical protein
VPAVTFAGSGGGATGTPAALSTEPATAQYVAAAFQSVLPSNAKLDESAAHPMIGYGYTGQGTNGGWYAGATATVLVSGKAYVFTLSVITGQTGLGPCSSSVPQKSSSGPQEVSLGGDSGTLDGSSFGVQTTSASSTTWYAWLLPEPPTEIDQPSDQESIVVTVKPLGKAANGAPGPFTVQQIKQLVTAKVWTEVLKDMPAVRE